MFKNTVGLYIFTRSVQINVPLVDLQILAKQMSGVLGASRAHVPQCEIIRERDCANYT